MTVTRRLVSFGLASALLAGCGGTSGAIAPTPSTTNYRPVPNAAFESWVAGFRSRAAGRGIGEATLNQAFRGVGFLPTVVERDRNQTEFVRTLEDYLAIAALDDNVRTGRAMLARHASVLAAIEAKYAVDPAVVVAIWGVESRYGTRRGEVPVISALATLAFDGRRGSFFEKQLMAALRILQRGDITPARMTGSWAGAMGHTQFIPTSFEGFAVDFNGDGRRDIWSDDPTDALASTAAYLSRSGWRHNQPWGIEIKLPSGFDAGLVGRGSSRSASAWAGLGVQAANGGALPNAGDASLILPAGTGAPGFLIYRNFTVITRYNNAEKYVIGVGHLSDRIKGAPPLRGTFPPDAAGMTLADRRDMQRRLTAAGFDTEGSDGVIGPKTRAAISAFQRRKGIAITGEPSLSLLRLLS